MTLTATERSARFNPWPWRRMTTEGRFWAHVDKRGADECWPWRSERLRSGHGLFAIRVNGRRRRRLAHRVAYESVVGPIPAGLFVCHRCDNGWCVNPAHLFLGTAVENNHDMVAKDRHARGERHWARKYPERLKLSADVVRDIRRRVAAGETHQSVAADLGVSDSCVGMVARRERWSHIQ